MRDKLMDIKSKLTYDKWWQLYNGFCDQKKQDVSLYGSFFDFVGFLSQQYKWSTIWQACSCVNKFIKLNFEKDFIKEESFKMFMKKLGKNYIPKQSSVFTLDDVHNCILATEVKLEAKVALIVGVFGACRVSELVAMDFNDLIYERGVFKITIRYSKTDSAGKGHVFYVSPAVNACPVEIIRRYIDCFDAAKRTGRFLRMIGKDGRGTDRAIGKNTVSSFAKVCADYLGKNVDGFSGHAFRRTSATIVADSGASMMSLKRHGRWSSEKVAEGYVAESSRAKMEVANMINGDSVGVSSSSASSSGFSISHCSFSNCVINFSHNN
jgi:integrase